MKAKVSEIFQSIQGEGKYTGVRQVFVRFFGCDVYCVWCDTLNSIDIAKGHFDEYGPDELIKKVLRLSKNCHSVSLTGGEPLLQKDFLRSFLPLLKENNLKVYLETNGVCHEALKEIIKDVDIIAMDLKLPSSTKCRSFWNEHEEFLKVALSSDVFIKTIVSSETTRQDVAYAAELVSRINRDIPFILQPDYFDSKNGAVTKCLEFQDDCFRLLNNVRVMSQMHKFLKLR